MKLNLDRDSKGNPRIFGVGGCIKSHHEIMKDFKSPSIPLRTNSMLTIQGLLIGLILAKHINITKMQMEGDSNQII
jgi:ribonuclease HI